MADIYYYIIIFILLISNIIALVRGFIQHKKIIELTNIILEAKKIIDREGDRYKVFKDDIETTNEGAK